MGRLSRRSILEQLDWQEPTLLAPITKTAVCSECSKNKSLVMANAATNTTEPARRRNSTYLALACANAVSQGAMTRKFRQMFENPPVQETPKPLSRAEIKEAIQAARLRRNSIAFQPHHQLDDLMEDTDPTTPLTVKVRPVAPPKPAKPVTSPSSLPGSPVKSMNSIVIPNNNNISPVSSSYYSSYSNYPNYPAPSSPTPSTMSVLCEKCSSVVQLPTSPPGSPIFNDPVTPVTAKPAIVVPAEQESTQNDDDSDKTQAPSNREVLPDELPKRDTVKNARSLFETSLSSSSGVMNFGTLQHVKSNPSSKIFRSESTMTLDRAGTRQPFRWTTSIDQQQQQRIVVVRSPSPSKPTKGQQPSYYRSSPSLYPRPHHHHQQRVSRHSTDVESYVSEAGSDCWSTSDLDSEASYSASSSEPDTAGNVLDGMRYISPEVMDKIRSYGMTLTFVNGIMVDEDDEQQMKMALKATHKKKTTTVNSPMINQQSIRSAGQSRTTASKAAAATIQAAKKQQLYNQHQQQQQPVRIVACVTKKIRHSSGESSASSGVGSAGTDSSPFGTLKRTKSSDASSERSPSPGPRRAGAAKAQTDSPFGCYSVVYQFNKASPSAANNKNASRTPMYV